MRMIFALLPSDSLEVKLVDINNKPINSCAFAFDVTVEELRTVVPDELALRYAAPCIAMVQNRLVRGE